MHAASRRSLLGVLVLSTIGSACTDSSRAKNTDGGFSGDVGVGGTGGAITGNADGQSIGGSTVSSGVDGGTTTGGSIDAGANLGTGGAMATGGSTGAAGAVATGGSAVTGGAMATGGSTGTAGAAASGGNRGTSGSMDAGGTVGWAGVVAGGTVGIGGTSATGGVIGAGGSVGAGTTATGAAGASGGPDAATSSGGSSGTDAAAVVDAQPDSLPTDDLGGSGCIGGTGIADDLIADFSTDSRLYRVDGRSGMFFVYGDSSISGSFDPPRVTNSAYPVDSTTGNPSCSGPGSFHTKATGFGIWGAAIRATFVAAPDGSPYQETYDASKYKGISFWARSATAMARVQVSFPDVYTDGGANPTALDPTVAACVYIPNRDFACSPYLVKFGDSWFPAYRDYQIDTTWKRFDIFFADTLQDPYNPGYHTSADKLDLHHLTGMDIQVGATYVNGTATANDFELWIDDVRFIE